jgi:hypothetical protein
MNRIVTGFDDSGKPAVILRGESPTVIHAGRYTTTELWVSGAGPLSAHVTDTSTGGWALEPPAGGACFRIVEIAPDQPRVPHDWQNRSGEPAVMVGVLLSAR